MEGEGQKDKEETETIPNPIKENRRILTVVLESCNLEVAKIAKSKTLLNSDEHFDSISKMGKSLEEYRPDITHHALLTLLDSPLNKAGLLQIYLKTKLNVCIKINPHIRLPRTYKRFNGLFAQLLLKLKIRGEGTSDFLLQVVKNPLESHFPMSSYKIGTSTQAKLVDIYEYVRSLPTDRNIIIAVGAVSHGHPGIKTNQQTHSPM